MALKSRVNIVFYCIKEMDRRGTRDLYPVPRKGWHEGEVS